MIKMEGEDLNRSSFFKNKKTAWLWCNQTVLHIVDIKFIFCVYFLDITGIYLAVPIYGSGTMPTGLMAKRLSCVHGPL